MRSAAQLQVDSYDRFIVKYHDRKRSKTVMQSSLDQAVSASGLSTAMAGNTPRLKPLRTMATGAEVIASSHKLDRVEADKLLRQLAADPDVAYAEIDRRKTIAAVPDDPFYAQYQWHYNNPVGGVNSELAWDVSTGEGVVVAVLDTGVVAHSDLDSNLLPGYDFINDADISRDGDGRDADPADEGDWVEANACGTHPAFDSSWHGTHVTGTVATVTNNAQGMAGLAYGARVVPVRVLGKCGGYDSDIVDAVIWAAGGEVEGIPANPNPAEVINLSLGGRGECSQSEIDAFSFARSQGATVVVAAGNFEIDVAEISPANCPGVIAVAATGITGEATSYTNFGERIDISAPGGDGESLNEDSYVWSTGNAGTTVPGEESYDALYGTSQAAPHVAATVALMQSAAETPLTPDQVLAVLKDTARDFAVAPDSDRPVGVGIVDAYAAVSAVTDTGDGEIPDGLELSNGVPVAGQSGGSQLYRIQVPAGVSNLLLITYGGSGNVNLYSKRDAEPTSENFDQRSARPGNNERVYIRTPKAGTYYLLLDSDSDYEGVNVRASYR